MPAQPKREVHTETIDPVDAIQAAWRRERSDIDVSSIAILTRAMLIGRHLAAARTRALADLGTDAATLDVLATLRRAGSPHRLRASQIASATRVSAGAVSQRVERLERAGLVRRLIDEDDRRGVVVTLTKKGRHLIDSVVGGLMERESKLLEPFEAPERRVLERLLTRWLRWLDQQAGIP